MTELEKANLVRSVAGRSGGFELNCDAGEITLADVYFAVEDGSVFRMHKTDPQSCCPVAVQLGKILIVAPQGGGMRAPHLIGEDVHPGCRRGDRLEHRARK